MIALLLAAAVAALPPLPPDTKLVPRQQLKGSQVILRLASRPKPTAQLNSFVTTLPGFRITSFQLMGTNATLTWQGAGPFQVQQASSVAGPWKDIGPITTNTYQTMATTAPSALYRIKKATDLLVGTPFGIGRRIETRSDGLHISPLSLGRDCVALWRGLADYHAVDMPEWVGFQTPACVALDNVIVIANEGRVSEYILSPDEKFLSDGNEVSLVGAEYAACIVNGVAIVVGYQNDEVQKDKILFNVAWRLPNGVWNKRQLVVPSSTSDTLPSFLTATSLGGYGYFFYTRDSAAALGMLKLYVDDTGDLQTPVMNSWLVGANHGDLGPSGEFPVPNAVADPFGNRVLVSYQSAPVKMAFVCDTTFVYSRVSVVSVIEDQPTLVTVLDDWWARHDQLCHCPIWPNSNGFGFLTYFGSTEDTQPCDLSQSGFNVGKVDPNNTITVSRTFNGGPLLQIRSSSDDGWYMMRGLDNLTRLYQPD